MFFRKKKESNQPERASSVKPNPAASDPFALPPAVPDVDSGTGAFLTGDHGLDQKTVEVLLAAIRRVTESRDLESLLVYIVDESIALTGAERGLLVLLDEGGGLHTRVARQRGRKPVEGLVRFSTTIVKRVLSDNVPVRATVTSDSEALELGTSVFDLKLRAVLCVPLVSKESASESGKSIRGVLYVDSKAATREFSPKDLSVFYALSQHIRVALQNAHFTEMSIEKAKLDQSIDLAKKIQGDLMPETPNDVPGYDVHGWYRPAEHTTGDFYDFVRMKRGKLGVFIGDVSGHGIGPALIMASAKSSLRTCMRLVDEPGAIVSNVNEDLAPRMDDRMFLTLFLAVLAPEGRLQTLNAGQTPPLLWRARTQTIETIANNAMALGMLDDFEYQAGPEFQLEPGDVLVAYTDGFVEARSASNREVLFGEEGMRVALERTVATGASAKEVAEALVRTALEFAGGIHEDDMTLVVVRRSAP